MNWVYTIGAMSEPYRAVRILPIGGEDGRSSSTDASGTITGTVHSRRFRRTTVNSGWINLPRTDDATRANCVNCAVQGYSFALSGSARLGIRDICGHVSKGSSSRCTGGVKPRSVVLPTDRWFVAHFVESDDTTDHVGPFQAIFDGWASLRYRCCCVREKHVTGFRIVKGDENCFEQLCPLVRMFAPRPTTEYFVCMSKTRYGCAIVLVNVDAGIVGHEYYCNEYRVWLSYMII